VPLRPVDSETLSVDVTTEVHRHRCCPASCRPARNSLGCAYPLPSQRVYYSFVLRASVFALDLYLSAVLGLLQNSTKLSPRNLARLVYLALICIRWSLLDTDVTVRTNMSLNQGLFLSYPLPIPCMPSFGSRSHGPRGAHPLRRLLRSVSCILVTLPSPHLTLS
jgi:hypothetical protein